MQPQDIFGELIVNNTRNGDQEVPVVAALPGGRFIVVWQDGSAQPSDSNGTQIRARVIDAADGTAIGNDFTVNTTTASNQSAPAVVALPDGRVIVTWTDASGAGGDASGTQVRARVFDADQPALGTDFLVNTTTSSNQANPAVTALADGRIVLTWEDVSGAASDGSGSQIRGRVLQADGSGPVDFTVNITVAGYQLDPSIAALADGRLVVAWRDDSGTSSDVSAQIRGRVLNADGSGGVDFRINSTVNGNQVEPAVAALAGGGFVVTWRDGSGTAPDTSATQIRGRVFDSDGAPLAADFAINTTTPLDQLQPSVAALSGGRFVVAWQDESSTGTSGAEIRARVMEPDGTSADPDFVVNTTSTLGQVRPSVAALPDGRFMVAWEDLSAGNGDIRAQIFLPPNSDPEHPETLDVSAAGVEDQPERIEIVLRGSDPDGTVAEFRVGPLATGALYLQPTGGEAVVQSGGTALIPAAGNEARVYFVPNANAEGRLTFDYVAIDDDGLEDPTPATVTLDIAEVNDLPDVRSPRLETDEDTALDHPAFHLFNSVDVDGDPTTAGLVTGPAHAASFELRPDGSFSYLPAADFNGEDQFTYRASDGRGGSAEGTVTIVVTPVDDGVVWTGTAGNDVRIGTGADETFNGLGGNDRLWGGGGDDVIDAGDGNDIALGGPGDDVIFGGRGVDELAGGDGDDVIEGGAGLDTLVAGSGSDVVIGGLGLDVIVLSEGEASRDIVRYFSTAESGPAAATTDRILGFDQGIASTDDRIDLSAIDADPLAAGDQAFRFGGPFTAAGGDVRVSRSGSNILVDVDTDSDAAAEMTIVVAGVTGLGPVDFIL